MMKKLFISFIFLNFLTMLLLYLNPIVLSTIISYKSLSFPEIIIYGVFMLDFVIIPFSVLFHLVYMCFNFVEKEDWLLKCYQK